MKFQPFFLALLFCASSLSAQPARIPLRVNAGVDTSNAEIGQVVALWRDYLNSNPDSVYDNPFWNAAEKKRYRKFDFLNSVYFTPSLYAFLGVWKATVMSVSETGEGYLIRTLFATVADSGFSAPYCIAEVAAVKENGEFRLRNVLPVNTRQWRRERVGSITFLFPPEHPFDRDLALRMSAFVDSLAALWRIPVEPTEFYLAEHLDGIFRMRGYDFYAGEGNKKGPGGLADVDNRIVFGAGQNEWYPHEFVHVFINPLFPKAHYYFLEGYAALLGGSKGHELGWHTKRLNEHLARHPEIDLNDLLSFRRFDAVTTPQYVFGGFFCRLALEKGGLPLLKRLMSSGNRDADLYSAVATTFGVRRRELNAFVRSGLAAWAAE